MNMIMFPNALFTFLLISKCGSRNIQRWISIFCILSEVQGHCFLKVLLCFLPWSMMLCICYSTSSFHKLFPFPPKSKRKKHLLWFFWNNYRQSLCVHVLRNSFRRWQPSYGGLHVTFCFTPGSSSTVPDRPVKIPTTVFLSGQVLAEKPLFMFSENKAPSYRD